MMNNENRRSRDDGVRDGAAAADKRSRPAGTSLDIVLINDLDGPPAPVANRPSPSASKPRIGDSTPSPAAARGRGTPLAGGDGGGGRPEGRPDGGKGPTNGHSPGQEGHPNSPEGSGRAQPLQSQPDGQPDGQLGRGALPRRKRGGVRERERKERERMRDMEQRRRAAEREMERTLNRERDRLMATVAAGGPAAGFVPLHAHAPPQHPVMVPSVPPKPPPRAPAPPPRSAAQSSTHARPLPASGARPPAPVASATPPANPPSAPAPPARPSAPLDPPPVPLSRETAERRRQAMLQQRASSAGRTAEHAPEAAPRPPPRAHPPPAASASVAVGARAPPAQAPSAAEPVTEEWKEKQASVGIPEGRSVCAAPPSTVSATAEPVVAHCIDELRSFGAKSRAAVLMETQRQMVKALWTGRDDMVSWLEGARKNGEEELSAVMSSLSDFFVRVRLGSSQLPQQLRDAGAKYAVMRVISVSPDPSSPSDFVVSGTIPFSAAPAEQKLRFASNAAPEDGEVEAWVTSVPRPREISQAECNRLRVLRKGLAAAAGPAPGSGGEAGAAQGAQQTGGAAGAAGAGAGAPESAEAGAALSPMQQAILAQQQMLMMQMGAGVPWGQALESLPRAQVPHSSQRQTPASQEGAWGVDTWGGQAYGGFEMYDPYAAGQEGYVDPNGAYAGTYPGGYDASFQAYEGAWPQEGA